MDIFRWTSDFLGNLFSVFNASPSKVEEGKETLRIENRSTTINENKNTIDLIKINRENLFLNEIIQNAEEGFLILDAHNNIKFINNFLLRKIGAPGNYFDYLNRNSIEIIRFPSLYESIKKISLKSNSTRLINLTCDTTQIEFEVLIKFFNISGENYLLTKWRDITFASKAEKIGKELVANVAHQLRTPLTSIKGYAETLLDGAFDDPSVSKKFLETILRNADRLTNLVRDILTLARLDDANNKLNYQNTNIISVVKNVIDQLANLAEDKYVKINFSHPENEVIIMGCQQELEIAVHNLLDNAIKYTGEKTSIDIKIEVKNGNMVLSIKDHGKGIPQKDLEKIFERFYRIEDGKSKKMIGTGLGLSIVKQIAELHDGRTWVESLWGDGATFYLEIPIVSPKKIMNSLTISSVSEKNIPVIN